MRQQSFNMDMAEGRGGSWMTEDLQRCCGWSSLAPPRDSSQKKKHLKRNQKLWSETKENFQASFRLRALFYTEQRHLLTRTHFFTVRLRCHFHLMKTWTNWTAAEFIFVLSDLNIFIGSFLDKKSHFGDADMSSCLEGFSSGTWSVPQRRWQIENSLLDKHENGSPPFVYFFFFAVLWGWNRFGDLL